MILLAALVTVVPPIHGDRAAVHPLAVVADLGPAASPIRLAADADSLYVIDAAPQHVRRYILNGLPYAELMTQVMRWREGADKLIMGRPLDLYLLGDRLFILDSMGTLWSYRGSDYTRALVPLRLQSNQGIVTAIALQGRNLLLLDPDRRQVWAYHPDLRGGYDTPPRGLLPHPLPSLAGARRLAAGRDALYVLLSAGGVLAIPWLHPGNAALLPVDGAATGVWAGPSTAGCLVSFARRIAFVAPGGAIGRQIYVEGMGGDMIRDVALSPTGRLYILTRTRIMRVAAPPAW